MITNLISYICKIKYDSEMNEIEKTVVSQEKKVAFYIPKIL